MSTIERDVVLMGVDGDGNTTIDLPITRLGNIEDTADVKETPAEGDHISIIDSADNGQMKKISVANFTAAISAKEAQSERLADFIRTLEARDGTINDFDSSLWGAWWTS